MTPKVSVIISLYNKEKYIARAVQSVLRQSVQDFEIVIVDDGSTDNGIATVKNIQDDRLRLIEQPNGGVSAARNKGIDEAKAELVAFLDADDEWLPDFLEVILRLRGLYPQAGAYATWFEICTSGKRTKLQKFKTISNSPWEGLIPDYFSSMVEGEWIVCASAVCVPKEVFVAIGGGFPVGEKLGEDLDVWGRIALNYPIAFSNRACAVYYQDAMNRASLKFPVIENLPFIKTGQEAILNKKVRPEMLHSLKEYIAREQLRVARSLVLSGDPKRAGVVLKNCQTSRFYLRKIFWKLCSRMPSSWVRGGWRLKQKFFRIRNQ
ncbi:MAG: glycosyltransferase family 2 protein [Candidatus Omnitrophica bacterium]|nr:glycosyltransferase family 2 protein [Candidatus Omnitrophota bacterium]